MLHTNEKEGIHIIYITSPAIVNQNGKNIIIFLCGLILNEY